MLSYVYIYIYLIGLNCKFQWKKRNLSRQSEWILRWNAVKPCGFKQKWTTKLPPKTTSSPSRVSSHLLDRNSVISPTLPWSSSQVFPLDGVLHHLPQSCQGGTHHFTIQKHLQLTLREIKHNYPKGIRWKVRSFPPIKSTIFFGMKRKQLPEVVTERTENPPVQTTPRLPLRNLIGQWNSLHASPETEADSMMNICKPSSRIMANFRANFVSFKAYFEPMWLITIPIFSSKCVSFWRFFSSWILQKTRCIQWFTFWMKETINLNQGFTARTIDMIGTWLFPTGSNKKQIIGFIIVPQKIRSNLAFCMDHTQQTSICLGYPIPNPTKIQVTRWSVQILGILRLLQGLF